MKIPRLSHAGGPRDDARRWLMIAERILSLRDLSGSEFFATRARNADPDLSAAHEILAVINTLIAADNRIENNQPDWYGVLGLAPPPPGGGDYPDLELLASKYRRLMLILNPHRNNFPFAEDAFRLVIEAWSVLSNPAKRSLYHNQIASCWQLDHELRRWRIGSTFWTVCPYCYYIYEYPSVYVDCALQCHNCNNASQAVPVPPPPPNSVAGNCYYRCWGVLPFGCSSVEAGRNRDNRNSTSAWTPLLPMTSSNNFAYDSQVDWSIRSQTNLMSHVGHVEKAPADKGKDVIVDPHVLEAPNTANGESSMAGSAINGMQQPGSSTIVAANQSGTVGMSAGNQAHPPALQGHDSDESDFFEGLEEFISSLICNP